MSERDYTNAKNNIDNIEHIDHIDHAGHTDHSDHKASGEIQSVQVTASGSYEVLIGEGLLSETGARMRGLLPGAETAFIVTDDTVDALYGDTLADSLRHSGFSVEKAVLPHGEESKNGGNYLKILNDMAKARVTRSDVLVALGGGMVGDLGGFCAATYQRGIACVQLPTTLLSCVDSSVGGKTAIDLDSGKNLAGAFFQPKLVLCDTTLLDSLSEDLFTQGCAEVIKYGVLKSPTLFALLERDGKAFDRTLVITECISIKRDYVCADEFDTGLRRQLNLGHTLGHAIEAASGFALSHGESVAAGLACVARASAKAGFCSEETACRIERLLSEFGLPVSTDYSIDLLMNHVLSDKKRMGKTLNVIVPEEIGRCRVEAMPVGDVKSFFEGEGVLSCV